MIWVAWRQQRTETAIAAAILLLLAALLLPTGLHMASAFDRDHLGTCTRSCGGAIQSFMDRFAGTGDLIAWVTLIPGLVGILLAAPLALQFEHRTYRLDWTQSITRRRWLFSKLALQVSVVLVFAVALTALLTWWRQPLDHLQGRMQQSAFDSEGIVVVAYAVFAFGLATIIAVTWRRAVPALVTGFAGFFAARLFVDTWLRQRLVTPLTLTWAQSRGKPTVLAHSLIVDLYPSDSHGQALPNRPVPCGLKTLGCLARHGVGYVHVVYQPASRFWPLQLRECAIFLGTGLVLTVFAAAFSGRSVT